MRNVFNCIVCGFLTLSAFSAFEAAGRPLVRTEAVTPPSDAHVYGHVIDRATGEHLPFVSVCIRKAGVATMTDATGHYFLKNLPVGEQEIEVDLVGYYTEKKTVSVLRNSTAEVNFELVEDRMALNEVVVTANRNATLRMMAPNVVNVLDGKLLEATQSTTLAQGLNFQPGLRVEDNCQNCGFSQVRINGLDGHYSQILLDSRPVFSALNGVYGLEQIPSNMIERVEVVRGGGSALFGASAIGGTINIITKEPVRNSASFSHDINAIGGFDAFDNNTMMNASIVTDNNKMGYYVYAQNRHRSALDINKDDYSDLPVLDNQAVGMSSYFRLSGQSRLSFDYHGLHEFRRGGNRLDRAPHEANITEQTEHHITGGNVDFDWNSIDERDRLNAWFSCQHTARKSFYGGTGETVTPETMVEATKAYGRTSGLTLVTGLQFLHKFEKLWFMPANLTVGAEYNLDDMDDRAVGYNIRNRQRIHILSLYGQNEWTDKQFTFLLGARLDKHSLLKLPVFSPRVTFRYNPVHGINLRLTYAGGFRAPQTFDEDLHIALVGGERLVTQKAENLKEEKSHSFSLSSDMYHDFGDLQANLLAEAFYTNLRDVFALRTLNEKDENGSLVQERYNAYGANVYGANLEGRLAFRKLFSLQGGLTLQKSRYTEPVEWDEAAPAERQMLRTPDVYGYVTMQLKPSDAFSAAVSGTYTGPMKVGRAAIAEGPDAREPMLMTTRSFHDIDLKLSYKVRLYGTVSLSLSGGVKNLFNAFQKDLDRGWTRDSNYMYGPSLPRNYFLSVRFSY